MPLAKGQSCAYAAAARPSFRDMPLLPARSNQPPRRTRRSRAHTFRISQIPIAECAAFSAPHPPRVLSLAAFGRRPLVYVAPLSLTVIRNPYMSVNLSRPFRTVPIRGHILILLFEPLQSPSFRPDPQSLKAVARRASQRMAVALIVPTRRLISRPLLDWPEHDGRLGRVGIALAARRACPQEIGQPRLYRQRPTDIKQLSTSVALPVV